MLVACATVREAGRIGRPLPIAWVANDQSGGLGAVGLGRFDIEERRDRPPWLLGMIVQRGLPAVVSCDGRGGGRQ